VNVRVVVIGGGITGLAAAEKVAAALGPGAVRLVERGSRLGGKISTEDVGGAIVEGGPDCFLAAKPAGLGMVRRLGLEHRLIGTDPRFRRSFVKRGGHLHELPEGISGLVPSRIGPLMRTRLLSPRGRLRAALELFVPRRTSGGDESIASFVTRRFGGEAWHWLIEPLLGGIHAGDGARLSLPATFPQLADTERTHGSVLRVMMTARLSGRRRPAGPTGFVTLRGGLGEMVAALEAKLDGCVSVGRAVRSITRDGGGWTVALDRGETIAAEQVIVATPANAAARMLDAADHDLAAELRAMRFASTVTVSVAFPAAMVPRKLPGYGYVTPRAEGGPVLATSWTSHKFPERVRGDLVLLRLFLGRDGDDAIAAEPDEAVKSVVRRELHDVHGITSEPLWWRVFRWPAAMPQYVLGHHDRLERIGRRLAALPGLAVAGSSFTGAGIPDCIAAGWSAADAAVASLRRQEPAVVAT
jgi:protoporphyrinogen/coproporphyrinogen III oxidase